MTKDYLRYDKMVENALRGVVREALSRAAEHGLSGGHHFYVTFRTGAPGVVVPDFLRAEYPEAQITWRARPHTAAAHRGYPGVGIGTRTAADGWPPLTRELGAHSAGGANSPRSDHS